VDCASYFDVYPHAKTPLDIAGNLNPVAAATQDSLSLCQKEAGKEFQCVGDGLPLHKRT